MRTKAKVLKYAVLHIFAKRPYFCVLSLNEYQALNINLRQHRTKPALRLCTSSACIFSVILHKNSLPYDSMPASFLCNLTKNLAAHLTAISVRYCLNKKTVSKTDPFQNLSCQRFYSKLTFIKFFV